MRYPGRVPGDREKIAMSEDRQDRLSQAVDALNAASGRIGHARAGNCDYGVYADNGETLVVEYEGWREGSVQYGLSGRAQPVRFTSRREHFDQVTIF